jgi:hypothetical protein
VNEDSISVPPDGYVPALSLDGRGDWSIRASEHEAAKRCIRREFPELGKTECSEAAEERLVAGPRRSWLTDDGERVHVFAISACEALERSRAPKRRLQRERMRRCRTLLRVSESRQVLFAAGPRSAAPAARVRGREARSSRRASRSSSSGRDPADPEPPPALAGVLAAACGRVIPQLVAAGISAALERCPDGFLSPLWAEVSARAAATHEDTR